MSQLHFLIRMQKKSIVGTIIFVSIIAIRRTTLDRSGIYIYISRFIMHTYIHSFIHSIKDKAKRTMSKETPTFIVKKNNTLGIFLNISNQII